MRKIYSTKGYYNCAYEIWMEFIPTGFKWIYKYFDMDHDEKMSVRLVEIK